MLHVGQILDHFGLFNWPVGGIPGDSDSDHSSSSSEASSSDSSDDDDIDNEDAQLQNDVDFVFNMIRQLGLQVDDDGNPIYPDGEEPPDDAKIHHFRRTKDTVSLGMLSTATWCDITLQHHLTDAAEKDVRSFQKITGGGHGCLLPGGLAKRRDVLTDMTGLKLRKHGRCPANCVAYDDEDTTTDICPNGKCRKPRFKVGQLN